MRHATTRRIDVSLPELAFVAATRAMAGVGVGLLLSAHLPGHARRRIGWTLVGLGAITTLPIAATVLGRRRRLRAD